MSTEPVLIVGAGPTGLVLALFLTRQGVRVRIIDSAPEPGTTSRAMAVGARTLELYRQVQLADEVVARGLKVAAGNIWVGGRPAAHLPFGQMGEGLSPYPFMLIFPQDQHERLLIERLASLGITVERGVTLIGLDARPDRVVAQLTHADGRGERCEAAYLAGCDGARSAVRHALQVDFGGGTYDHLFYVADVAAGGRAADRQLHVAVDSADFVAIFPLAPGGDVREAHAREGHVRLIGSVLPAAAARGGTLGWQDVSAHALSQMPLDVKEVCWFSTYHVHHRVADRFRQGRVFLLGDAAHVHSPVGGQGMNTGIGDAVNLAWKLAGVLHDAAPPALLDSYEPERIAFARRLVATTDRLFQLITRDGALAAAVRTRVVPRLLGALVPRKAVRRFMFRAVSQIEINYRDGALASGRAGKIRAGDRMPFVPAAAGPPDNLQPLPSPGWQVQVHGELDGTLRAAAEAEEIALRLYPWTPAAEAAGLARNAAYLMRPDGYVGWCDRHPSAPGLTGYLRTHGLRPAKLAVRAGI
ncbi:MAG TPA: FAD-dependent monooxygenase [Polyangia bacterium]|jgi:2-polyprenyl-6-methoxyphenol hydroxylase-like FAD-dependent oxidoreductase|nr:FAD-dependent monooxygenase [Polyangia bacterium]